MKAGLDKPGRAWMLFGKLYDSSCRRAPGVRPSWRTGLRFASWREKYTAMSATSAGLSRSGGTCRDIRGCLHQATAWRLPMQVMQQQEQQQQ